MTKVGIIGDGNVGGALREGLQRKHDVKAAGKEPGRVAEIAKWADVIILAVPFGERENAIREMGGAHKGKPLIDVTNAVGADQSLAIEPTRESGAEQVQKWADGAKVVKAFNTVFAQHMSTGEVNGEKLTLFVAGNDNEAKNLVRDLGRDIGFDPVDAGPLKNARWMETLGYFNIQLGYGQKMGPNIGFKLVR
ncbi:MAG: 8-hydroxy-5-deazaflavin:NADPH oxidoreductase [Thermoplasmata archaeon]|jgi:predicted dinucleotide-binding enzyme|nr:8-hydroxy-5-deazaflavin:NADPH oxidoreductase [Thermoplasmata archaeon]